MDWLRQPESVSVPVWPKVPGSRLAPALPLALRLAPALRSASELVLESVSPQNSKKPWQRLRPDKVSESINKESSSNVGEDRSFESAPMLQIWAVLAS